MIDIITDAVKTRIKNLIKGADTQEYIVKYEEFANIGMLDTGVGSLNLGDFIIMDSINREISSIFEDRAYITSYPTHLNVSGRDRRALVEKEILFACGTNMLNSTMGKRRQWNIKKDDIPFYYKRCVLFGVGWGSYDKEPDDFTRHLLKSVLSEKYTHSVRDSYTKDMLKGIGIHNVINTGCPTTWRLDNNLIRTNKAGNALTTITYYDKNHKKDKEMIDILSEEYQDVYLWIQSIADLDYLKELDLDPNKQIKLISPSLNAYTNFLDKNINNVDFIGTRLHAGIYAMQRGIRTCIVGIDNRATEIGKDINIQIVQRKDISQIKDFINKDFPNKINLPYSDIKTWKEQFSI